MWKAVQWPSFGSSSIAVKAALALSVLIGGLFIIAAYLSYTDARERSLASSLALLDAYNREVVGQQEDRFRRLAAAHQHATELLMAELENGSDIERQLAFEVMVPPKGDGTRRTAAGLYEGGTTPFGYIRGIGGFVGQEPDATRKSLLAAAIRVVHAIGEGARPDLKNFSFFTPDNTLIMFAPDRPDKLLFYRRDAGPELDFQTSEFVTVTRRENNPVRQTACTSLQPILYDKTNQTWTTGCHTPVDIDGVHIGAWGNSLLLDDILATSRFEDYPGTAVILVSREGRLIRHPDYTRQGSAATERYLDLTKTKEPRLRNLWDVLGNVEGDRFVGFSPKLDGYVSIRRIPISGWYAVTVQSSEYAEAPARRALRNVTLIALTCLTLQSALLFAFLRRNVARPLRALIREANQLSDRVAQRASDRIELAKEDEVGVLTAQFRTMSQQVLRAHATLENRVAERTRQLEEANGKLRRVVARDQLTGLYNRRKLLEILEEEVAAEGSSEGIVLMLLDLDHFKRINDTHGHPAGDRVLCELAQRIHVLLRPCDTIARLGGDEFAVIARKLRGQQEAAIIADAIIEALSQPIMLREGEVSVGVSIGIAALTDDVGMPSQLMVRADLALAEAKKAGKGCHYFFDPTMEEAAARKNAMAERLEQAFVNGEMKVFLQPIVSLETGIVEFAESLIRWDDGSPVPIAAGEFIEVIEEFQMASRLEQALFSQVFGAMREWQRAGVALPIVTLNLSGANLKQVDFCERIMAAANDHGLRPEMIALEIVESTLIDRGAEIVMHNLMRLTTLGFHIMLDDFGTGYASLTHLMKLPIHSIKIDKSFIQTAVQDGPGEKIASAILALASELGIRAVGEGVETEGQLDYLVKKGCHYAQGYFFYAPVPLEAFERYLRGGVFETSQLGGLSSRRSAAT